MYIKRHIEEVLKSAVNEKGALCVTGAKQVGKMCFRLQGQIEPLV